MFEYLPFIYAIALIIASVLGFTLKSDSKMWRELKDLAGEHSARIAIVASAGLIMSTSVVYAEVAPTGDLFGLFTFGILSVIMLYVAMRLSDA